MTLMLNDPASPADTEVGRTPGARSPLPPNLGLTNPKPPPHPTVTRPSTSFDSAVSSSWSSSTR